MRSPFYLLIATYLLACGPQEGQTPVKQPAIETYHGCGIPSTEENPAPCGNPTGNHPPEHTPQEDVVETEEAPAVEQGVEDDRVPAKERGIQTDGAPTVFPKAYDGCGIPSTPENPDPCGRDLLESDTPPR